MNDVADQELLSLHVINIKMHFYIETKLKCL